MKNPSLVAIAAAFALSLSLLSLPARAQSPATAYGPCVAVRVVDGDSADLRCGARELRVRMRNVSAPRVGQVGHSEAARGLAELLRARQLYVVSEVPGLLPVDANGRALAYLVDRNGANMNVALVLLGWATYSTEQGASRFDKSFRAAEQQAHAERRAMWTVWSVAAGGAPNE
jgi:endonuclease YncB( thermonuclease family)